MYENNFPVFEELPSADNASGFRSGLTSGPSSATTTPMEPPALTSDADYRSKLQRTDSQYSQDSQRTVGKNSRVLVASRHLRNDSKTIQLESRSSHSHNHSRSHSRDLSLDQLKQLALKSMESLDLTALPLPLPKCVDEESKRLIEGGVLRHRRTSSKDMKPPESKHKRTSSHHITVEHELSLQLQKGRSVDQLAASPLDPRV